MRSPRSRSRSTDKPRLRYSTGILTSPGKIREEIRKSTFEDEFFSVRDPSPKMVQLMRGYASATASPHMDFHERSLAGLRYWTKVYSNAKGRDRIYIGTMMARAASHLKSLDNLSAGERKKPRMRRQR